MVLLLSYVDVHSLRREAIILYVLFNSFILVLFLENPIVPPFG